MDRALRAQVLMAEAVELGVSIDDLIVAAKTLKVGAVPVTVADFVATIAPLFAVNTAATYETYWRLAIAEFGDRPVCEITVEDCARVVAEAERRARSRRS